jgi:hypothetical protein
MTIPSSSSGWTLEQIRGKLRSVTGTPGTDQLSDDQCDAYINNYYLYTMPFELKNQVQLDFLDFKVFPGVNVYDFPGNFLTDQPMAYADGFPLIFYQDPDIFYQDFPQQYATDSLATGDGSTTNFTGNLQNPPVIIGTLFITDSVQVLQDDGSGTFTGDGTGTIDYVTGAYNVTFTTAPASSLVIYAKYQGYQPNRPQGVLFFNNEFTFMPVPDQVYQIRMQGYINPLGLSSDADSPTLQEWGQLLAYGASLDVFADRGDLENYDRYSGLLKRFENVALARTIQQFQAEQSLPRF